MRFLTPSSLDSGANAVKVKVISFRAPMTSSNSYSCTACEDACANLVLVNM